MTRAMDEVDVWSALDAHIDGGTRRPCLGSWVECREWSARGGGTTTVVANRRDLEYLRFDQREAELLNRLDGSRTIQELCVEQIQQEGGLDVAMVAGVVTALHEAGCLTEPYRSVDAALARALAPKGVGVTVRRFFSTMSAETRRAEALVRLVHRGGARFLFSGVAVVAGLALSVAGAAAFVSLHDRGHHVDPQSAVAALALVLALNAVVVFFHEMGHAAFLVHRGRRVRAAGFRIYFGSPSFYVDSSDALMLDRRGRILQSLAGPYFELLVTSAIAITAWALPTSSVTSILYAFVALDYLVIFLNLVPLLELDGYWVFADLLRVHDLRARSLALVRHGLWTRLRRHDRLSRTELVLALYGTASIGFGILAIAVAFEFWRQTFGNWLSELWGDGWSGRLILVVVLVVVAAPLAQGVVRALGGIARAGLAIADRVRFRAQRRWRIEAAELLDAAPLFVGLPEDVLNEIAGRVRLVSVAAGVAVVEQGEPSDAMYLVRQGELEVVEHAGDAERVLTRVGRGDTFGELGLASGAVRAAGVVARTRSTLFTIDAGSFDHFLADHVRLPTLAATVQQLSELQALPPFAHLSTEQLREVREHGAWRHVAPGEVLVREGDTGEAFFIVGSGRMIVTKDGEVVGDVGPGEHFGELALLFDAPRAATVVAVTPTRVFELARDAFDRLVAEALTRGTGATTRAESFQRV